MRNTRPYLYSTVNDQGREIDWHYATLRAVKKDWVGVSGCDMTADPQRVGQWGEGIAVDYLVAEGYQILDRNIYSSGGEIDIAAFIQVAGQARLVFVEVKTRTSSESGFPEESFTTAKYHHLLHAIEKYLDDHPHQDWEWQIDVISIVGEPMGDPPEIEHFQQIVMPDERE